jgi:hypothetical protein
MKAFSGRLLDGHLGLDGIEEAGEFLVPVALHVAADDGTVENVESREQHGRAVTFVVVGHRSGATLLHRQTGRGAGERAEVARDPHRHQRRGLAVGDGALGFCFASLRT